MCAESAVREVPDCDLASLCDLLSEFPVEVGSIEVHQNVQHETEVNGQVYNHTVELSLDLGVKGEFVGYHDAVVEPQEHDKYVSSNTDGVLEVKRFEGETLKAEIGLGLFGES